jgi:hypothetical protein
MRRFAVLLLPLLAACAQMPNGPTVAVMPAANKPFDVFMHDDSLCRGWAAHSLDLPGHDAAAGATQDSVAPVEAQRRYDIAYQQCMYARGNVVPGYAYPGHYYPPPPPAPTR